MISKGYYLFMAAAVEEPYFILDIKKLDPKFTLVDPTDRMCCICYEDASTSSVLYDSKKETPFAVCQNLCCMQIMCIVCKRKAKECDKPFARCPFCRHQGELLTKDEIVTKLQLTDLLLCQLLCQKYEKIVVRHDGALVECETCNTILPYAEIPAHIEECRFNCPNECGEMITKNTKHSSCKRVECKKCHSTYLLKEYHNPHTCLILQERQHTVQFVRDELSKHKASQLTEHHLQAYDKRMLAQDAHIAAKSCVLSDLSRVVQRLQQNDVPELFAELSGHDIRLDLQRNVIETQENMIRELREANKKLTSKCEYILCEFKRFQEETIACMRRTEEYVKQNVLKQPQGAAVVALPSLRGRIINVTDIEAGYVQIDTPVQKSGANWTGSIKTIVNLPDKTIMIVVELKNGQIQNFVSSRTGEFEKLLFA